MKKKNFSMNLLLALFTIILLFNPSLAQSAKVIVKIEEGNKILFQGTLMEEEIIQIPTKGYPLTIELLFQSQERISLYIGGDFIIKEVSGASFSMKTHRIMLEKLPENAVISLRIVVVPEVGKTILAVYDEEERPIAMIRNSSFNMSSVIDVRNLISSLQNELDNSPLPDAIKAKYRESLYKAVMMLSEERISEAEKIVVEASDKFKIEKTKFQRIAQTIEQARKTLTEKAPNLDKSRLLKAIELINTAEEELMQGNYNDAEILLAQIGSTLNPSLLEQISDYLPLLLGFTFVIFILAISVQIIRWKGRKSASTPSQEKGISWSA